MMEVLVFLALVAGLVGLVFASQATIGVAIVGFACMLAIFARIAQASHHHRLAHPGPLIDPAVERSRQEQIATPPTPSRPRERLAIAAAIALVIAAVIGATFWSQRSRTAAPAVAKDEPARTLRSVQLQGTRQGDGWRIDNRTDVGWRGCVAESGISKARFQEIGPYGSVALAANQFEPPFREAGDGLEVSCEAPTR